MNNTDWMLNEIANAQSIERLTWLGEVIKYDADHGEPYALTPMVEELRQAWKKQKELLIEIGETMLVLSRYKDQDVIIKVGDETIVVKIVNVSDTGAVRLGVTAGPNVIVHRKEVQDAIDNKRPVV